MAARRMIWFIIVRSFGRSVLADYQPLTLQPLTDSTTSFEGDAGMAKSQSLRFVVPMCQALIMDSIVT
jgi:hypothetical protein